MNEKIYEIKEYLLNKKYLIVIILTLLIIIGVSIYLIINNINKNNESVNYDNFELVNNEIKEEIKTDKETCMIDIKGYVNIPGLYELDCQSRVMDVIEKAGGLKDDSNTSVINLSKKVFDQMVIIIYSNAEVADFTKVLEKENIIEEKCINKEVVKNDACVTKENKIETTVTVTTNSSNLDNSNNNQNNIENKMISINTATKEELMTLSGIGESKALAIINYREENNGFKTLEEIMNVSGIGEKVFVKIKDYITL